MNPLAAITEYLARMERRCRLFVCARGAAMVAASALTLTIAIALMLVRDLSPASLVLSRMFLFLGIATAATFAFVVPLFRMNQKSVARRVERRFPQFDQRLLTITERQSAYPADPFLSLLAESTLETAIEATPEAMIRDSILSGWAIIGTVSIISLGWLILWSHGRLADGAQTLWATKNVFSIEIQPGHKNVQRGADQNVTARLIGFTARTADLWVRYAGSGEWSRSPMGREQGTGNFEFEFVHLRASAEFYVKAEGVRSRVSMLRVVDLPVVRGITVSFTYPSKNEIDPAMQVAEGKNGDLFAPAGTVARIEIETDRPLGGGELVFEAADPIKLVSTRDNRTSAELTVLRDDGYHVSMMFGGELVQISREHWIDVPVRDRSPRGPSVLLNGVHSGSVPAGYEHAVAEYYKRLSEQLSE